MTDRYHGNNFFLCYYVLLLLVLLISGCATKTRITMLEPAMYHEACMTKTVAVLPFHGPQGHEIASELEGVLSGITIDDKPFFNLVDRTALDKVMSEYSLNQSGMISQQNAAKLGKMVGAQGIYTGTVSKADYTDSPYKTERSECSQYKKKYDKKGNEYQGNCIQWRKYYVDCVKRTATFAVTPKLIDVTTARIIYSHNLSASTKSSACSDESPAIDGDQLIQNAKNIVKDKFRKDVAPFPVTREVKLMDSTDGIQSDAARGKLKQGLKYTENNRFETACELWGEARSLCPDSSYALLFNLGVCAEAKGDATAAYDLYKKADKLLGKPDEDITQALTRASNSVKRQNKLREQLVSGKKQNGGPITQVADVSDQEE
jgi:tetratricopeptide (TPR) repeat protein